MLHAAVSKVATIYTTIHTVALPVHVEMTFLAKAMSPAYNAP